MTSRTVAILTLLMLSSSAFGEKVTGAWVDMIGYGFSGEVVQFEEGVFKYWSSNDYGAPSCEPCLGTYRESEESIYLNFEDTKQNTAAFTLFKVFYEDKMYLSRSKKFGEFQCWKDKRWYLFNLDTHFDQNKPFRYREKFAKENQLSVDEISDSCKEKLNKVKNENVEKSNGADPFNTHRD